MILGLHLNVKEDTATPALIASANALQPAKLNPIIGRSASNTIREHLFGLNQSRPNKLGGQRTNFYGQAARATNFQFEGETIVVSIPQVGMALRYYGGTIRPKSAKYLTIPVNPLAHGKRAREMDLELVFDHEGKPIALATKDTRAVSLIERRGKIVKRQIGQRGEIMFILRKSVTQLPDPTVLPYDELILSRISRDVSAYIDRVIARNSGGAS